MGLCFRKWILFPANFLFAGTFFNFSAHRPIFIFRNKVITLSETLHPVHQGIMVDIVHHIFFHLIGHRAVLRKLLKDGLLEFFHRHLLVWFVRYRNRCFSAGAAAGFAVSCGAVAGFTVSCGAAGVSLIGFSSTGARSLSASSARNPDLSAVAVRSVPASVRLHSLFYRTERLHRLHLPEQKILHRYHHYSP